MAPLLLGWGGAVHAKDLADTVDEAAALLKSGDPKAAIELLESIEENALRSDEVISGDQLAKAFQLRGAAWYRRGRKGEKRAMAAWRSGLAIANELPWDTTLLGEGDDWSVYLALAGEVGARPQADVGVPEQTGLAEVYIDGVRVRSGESVLAGAHIGQIVCDDKTVQTVWTSLTPAPDWFSLCPDGVDTSVVVTEEDEDEWGDLAPSFGPPDGAVEGVDEGEVEADTTSPPVSEEDTTAAESAANESTAPMSTAASSEESGMTGAETEQVGDDEEVVQAADVIVEEDSGSDTLPPSGADDADAVADASPDEQSARGDDPAVAPTDAFGIDVLGRTMGLPQLVVTSSGAGMLVAGTAMYFVKVAPALAEVRAARAAPESITRLEADDLVAEARKQQSITTGVLGTGAALLLGGVGWTFFSNTATQPYVGPTGIGLVGEF